MWHAWERREKCTRFWWENPKDKDCSEDQSVDERMGSEWILGRLTGGRIQVAQDRYQWQVLVYMVMKLVVLVPHS
jgi:hypothetical protein